MTLTTLDWCILGGFLVFPFLVALWSARRASQGLGQYFLAGRDLPWWLAGTSMVATTFAADTPLAVAGLAANRRHPAVAATPSAIARATQRAPAMSGTTYVQG